MPQDARSRKSAPGKKTRKVDAESGFNRTKPQKVLPPSSDEEEEFEDSDVESVLSIPVKDNTNRKTKAPKKAKPSRSDPMIEGEEDDEPLPAEKDAPIAPHLSLLLAASYFVPIMSVSAPTISSYLPDCYSLFTVAFRMMDLLFDNWKLHEICPQFSSVAFYTFVGYTYFYQVLLARSAVPGLARSREEKRCLQRLEQTCHPSGWPIPGPLAGIVLALGYVKPSDTYFSYIVPLIPDTSSLNSTSVTSGLSRLNNLPGSVRFPIIPALVQFVHNYASGAAKFKDGHMIPVSDSLGSGTPAVTFLGITSQGATTDNFQTLAFNGGWNSPVEDESLGSARLGMARRYWKRQSVPDVESKAFNDIEKFLCLTSDIKTEWIRQMAAMVKVLDRFFPGGTNLAALGSLTTVHSLTRVQIDVSTARVGKTGEWYRGRSNWNFKFHGYDDTDKGRVLTRLGLVTGTNSDYTNNVVPYGSHSAERSGPFFVAEGTGVDATALPRFESYGETDTDPLARIGEQLAGSYNAQGLL